MPGLVKIGMTTRDSIDAMMKELYSTGVPVPFDCSYACEVKVSDCAKIEKALHTALGSNRINANREFFSIKPEQGTTPQPYLSSLIGKTLRARLVLKSKMI